MVKMEVGELSWSRWRCKKNEEAGSGSLPSCHQEEQRRSWNLLMDLVLFTNNNLYLVPI